VKFALLTAFLKLTCAAIGSLSKEIFAVTRNDSVTSTTTSSTARPSASASSVAVVAFSKVPMPSKLDFALSS